MRRLFTAPPLRWALALALVGVLLLAWRPLQPGAPPGCEAVFSATTRGGASPPRGGACSIPGGARTPGANARVIRVIDGDTVELADGRRVRYIGIDTPELRPPEPLAREATEYNRRLVEGRMVRLERDVSDTDRYGRLLRYVWVDGILVNAELVREGYAEAREYPPDTRYAPCLEALEEEARRFGRGIWSRRN